MSAHVRWLTTDEQRQRFHLARRVGGLCAACGRALGPDEVVYVEPFTIGPEGGPTTGAYGPVGAECAAPAQVRQAESREPERCVGCGRGVYYRMANSRRQRVTCSRRCAARASAARQPKAEG